MGGEMKMVGGVILSRVHDLRMKLGGPFLMLCLAVSVR